MKSSSGWWIGESNGPLSIAKSQKTSVNGSILTYLTFLSLDMDSWWKMGENLLQKRTLKYHPRQERHFRQLNHCTKYLNSNARMLLGPKSKMSLILINVLH